MRRWLSTMERRTMARGREQSACSLKPMSRASQFARHELKLRPRQDGIISQNLEETKPLEKATEPGMSSQSTGFLPQCGVSPWPFFVGARQKRVDQPQGRLDNDLSGGNVTHHNGRRFNCTVRNGKRSLRNCASYIFISQSALLPGYGLDLPGAVETIKLV